MSTDTDFNHNAGFMPTGNDLHQAEVTLEVAKKMALQHADCLGFTFEGPQGVPPADAVLKVFFKSSAEWSPTAGWHSFTKTTSAQHSTPPLPPNPQNYQQYQQQQYQQQQYHQQQYQQQQYQQQQYQQQQYHQQQYQQQQYQQQQYQQQQYQQQQDVSLFQQPLQKQQEQEQQFDTPAWRFERFDRVICRLTDGWSPGKVAELNVPDPEDESKRLPYVVMIDPPIKRLISVPMDSNSYIRPEVCFGHRKNPAKYTLACLPKRVKSSKAAESTPRPQLRFAVSERVACLVEDDKYDSQTSPGNRAMWKAGTVAELWVRPPWGADNWGEEEVDPPYAVDMDDGCRVLVHRDDHQLIRDHAYQPEEIYSRSTRFTTSPCNDGSGGWIVVDQLTRKTRPCSPPTLGSGSPSA